MCADRLAAGIDCTMYNGLGLIHPGPASHGVCALGTLNWCDCMAAYAALGEVCRVTGGT